ncbi:MAG: hypothetical protein EB038_08595 [Cyclobacteriaceae bacterium]|nr:hypothetical protein [Cyclobacteriaceae bacterium]
MIWSEMDLELLYQSKVPTGVNISGGWVPLPEESKLRADIVLSFVPVVGRLNHYGTIVPLEGRGGIEHLATDLEVYKFSKSWELTRSISKSGFRILSGGYSGKEKGEFFKQISVLDSKGNIVLSEKIESERMLGGKREEWSGYILPTILEYQWNSPQGKCTYRIMEKTKLGSINLLESISALLRFFIEVFFAKPFQIHFKVDTQLDCNGQSWKAEGIHSWYLINP